MPSIAKICKVSDCDNEYHSKELCSKHYARYYRTGSAELKTTQDRFWSKVSKSSGCWEWVCGRYTLDGYGMFSIGHKTLSAHRYSYFLYHKYMPPRGMVIDHLCRNKVCVRPSHLEMVTSRENTVRGNTIKNKKSKLPLGVSKFREKFMVYKCFNGTRYYLGVYNTPQEASVVYQTANF